MLSLVQSTILKPDFVFFLIDGGAVIAILASPNFISFGRVRWVNDNPVVTQHLILTTDSGVTVFIVCVPQVVVQLERHHSQDVTQFLPVPLSRCFFILFGR